MNNLENVAKKLAHLLKKDKNVYVLVIDGWECYFFNEAKKSLSEEERSRIINMGIAEQNAVSFASGLALNGKTVYLVMFAAFLTMRAAEQLKLDVGFNNANVKLIAIHGGFSGPRIAGYSHYALEDLALLNTIPNMKIANIAHTACEIDYYMDYSYKNYGPIYLRLDNPSAPYLGLNYKVEKGKISKLIEPSNSKFAILATGNMVGYALDVIKKFNLAGVEGSLYSVHSIKPFDDKGLENILSKNRTLITMEEHVAQGGLASIVAMNLAQRPNNKTRFVPYVVKNKEYNIVFENYDNTVRRMFACHDLFCDISKIVDNKKNNVFRFLFAKRMFVDKQSRVNKVYKVLGIPLYRETFAVNKRKFYFFGIKVFSRRVKI